jgi:hypothetical protein
MANLDVAIEVEQGGLHAGGQPVRRTITRMFLGQPVCTGRSRSRSVIGLRGSPRSGRLVHAWVLRPVKARRRRPRRGPSWW